MTSRGLMLVTLLAAGVAVPYVASHPDVIDQLTSSLEGIVDYEGEDGRPMRADGAPRRAWDSQGHGPWSPSDRWGTAVNGWSSSVIESRTDGPPVMSFGDLLRFDVTPEWVLDSWSRVSTHLAELDLEGLRVTTVSGTGLHDVAGALTYYFDRQRQVQRIAFHGTTGNAQQLVALATQQFGLRQEAALGHGLFLGPAAETPLGILRVEQAPVVRSQDAYGRLRVDLELNRPSPQARLSDEFQKLLDQDRRSQRWQGSATAPESKKTSPARAGSGDPSRAPGSSAAHQNAPRASLEGAAKTDNPDSSLHLPPNRRVKFGAPRDDE